MTHGIYVEPNAASFTVAPAQFATLEASIKGASGISNLVITQNGGSATVQGVDFAWSYDGTTLIITIMAKHGFLVEHYPNASIFDSLSKKLLGGIPYTTGQVKTA